MPKGRPKKVVSLVDTDGEVSLKLETEENVRAETSTEEQKEEVTPIEMDAPEWTDYIMNQFRQDELSEGCPTVDGLRRIAQKELGLLVSSKPLNTNVSSDKTTTIYEVKFHWSRNDGRFGTIVEFGGVADASEQNAKFPYNQYPAQLSETRAEIRALKKALGLRRILAAEEINPDLVVDPKEKANGTQLITIKTLCARLTINLDKFLEKFSEESGVKNNGIDNVTYDFATKCIQRLNQYQADSNNSNHLEIPQEIKESV